MPRRRRQKLQGRSRKARSRLKLEKKPHIRKQIKISNPLNQKTTKIIKAKPKITKLKMKPRSKENPLNTTQPSQSPQHQSLQLR
jgi:hypothetical protein